MRDYRLRRGDSLQKPDFLSNTECLLSRTTGGVLSEASLMKTRMDGLMDDAAGDPYRGLLNELFIAQGTCTDVPPVNSVGLRSDHDPRHVARKRTIATWIVNVNDGQCG